MVIGKLLNRPTTMLYAPVASIVCLGTSTDETLRMNARRIVGVIFGGVLGFITLFIGKFIPYYAEWLQILMIPLAMLLDICVCNILRLKRSVVISCVLVLLVARRTDVTLGESLDFAVNYTLDTVIGCILAVGVNVLLPYKMPQEAAEKNMQSPEKAADNACPQTGELGGEEQDGDQSAKL